MKIAPYVERLNSSVQFKEFNKSHNGAFIVAGFFILDFESGKNVHQIDYYVPSKKKVAAFTLDGQVTMQLMDLLTDKVPEKMDLKTKVDLDQLRGILEDEMKNRNITDDIKKIIAVVQSIEGKKIWNLNCILSGMGILNAHVEDNSRSVLKMEKKSFMDIMKKMPNQQAPSQVAPQQGAVSPAQLAPKDAKEKIKQLEAIKKEIEREEAELESSEKSVAPQKAIKANDSKKIQEKLNAALSKAAKSSKTSKTKSKK